MAKPDLGTKRECPKCSAKFYDLGRRPARCPKCASEFDPDLVVLRRKAAADPVDDEEVAVKVKDPESDGFEDEVDDTPEVGEAGDDIVVDDEDDDDAEGSGLSDDIPDGFEEDDGEDPVDEDDTTVLLDDDEDDDFGDFPLDDDEDL